MPAADDRVVVVDEQGAQRRVDVVLDQVPTEIDQIERASARGRQIRPLQFGEDFGHRDRLLLGLASELSGYPDNALQPLRVGVVEDPSGKRVGRATVQEGDGLNDANEAMLQARRYVCDSEGSRAAEVEAKPEDIMTVGPASKTPPNLSDIASLNIKLTDFAWRKGGFNNVMIATFTIENNNPFSIKDIDIACEIRAQSGTVLGHLAKAIYNLIPAGGHKVVRDFNMGVIDDQADRVSCKLGRWYEGQAE